MKRYTFNNDGYYARDYYDADEVDERLLVVASEIEFPLAWHHDESCECRECRNTRRMGELLAGLKEMAK